MRTNFFAALALSALFSLHACSKERSIDEPGLLVPKTVEQDPSLPYITVNGVKLHSRAYGPADSAIVLALHGGPGSDHRYMLAWQKLAGEGYRVVFYDQRGMGLSERLPAESYTSIDQMTDEVRGVIAHYRTRPEQKVFIIGDSWGGMLGAAFVNRFPDEIQGLIISEAGGFVWQDVVDYVGRSRDFSLWSETLNNVTYTDQFITPAVRKHKNGDEHEILDYKFAVLASNNPITGEDIGEYWRFGAVANNALFNLGQKTKPSWIDNLKNFQPEVLFFYSGLNKAYGRAHAEKVSDPFKKVRLVEMPDEGHGMLFSPTGFPVAYSIILEYLDSLR